MQRSVPRLVASVLAPLGIAGAATGVLAAAGPSPAEVRLLVGSAPSFTADYGPEAAVVIAAALLGWACLIWLSGAALLAVAGELPGGSGRLCRALGRYIVPAAIYPRGPSGPGCDRPDLRRPGLEPARRHRPWQREPRRPRW